MFAFLKSLFEGPRPLSVKCPYCGLEKTGDTCQNPNCPGK